MDRQLNIAFGFLSAAAILLAAFSIALPETIWKIVFSVEASNIIVEELLPSIKQNQNVLEAIGYADYALGFSALLVLLLPIMAIGTFVLASVAVIHAKEIKIVHQKGVLWKSAALFIIFTSMYLYVYLSGDVYMAADGDFTGIFRPYFGSLLVASGVGCAPYFFSLTLATIRSSFGGWQ